MKPIWTCFGHWEDDGTLALDDFEPGEVEDEREEDFRYEGGLWAASGPGDTPEEAFAALRKEYEGGDDDDD